MAKEKQKFTSVKLTSPKGTSVTVDSDLAKELEKAGYKRSRQPAQPVSDETQSPAK